MSRFLCILAIMAFAQAASAEERHILLRLMDKPVTLFDWGMAQLDRDIERAARRSSRDWGGLAEPKSGSLYEWRTKQVKLYATLWLLPADRTRENCAAIFSEIVAEMTQSAPAGLGSAGWYLQNAFQPEGHFWAGRFEDVGGKLLEVVELQIALSPPPQTSFGDGGPRVECFAGLDATPPEIQFGAGL